VFWVAGRGRWSQLQAHAKQATTASSGRRHGAIRARQPTPQGVLPKGIDARAGLDQAAPGELIDVIATIRTHRRQRKGEGLSAKSNRYRGSAGPGVRITPHRFAQPRARNAASSTTPSCVVLACGDAEAPTRAASYDGPAAARAACSCRARSSWKATADRLGDISIYGQGRQRHHPAGWQ